MVKIIIYKIIKHLLLKINYFEIIFIILNHIVFNNKINCISNVFDNNNEYIIILNKNNFINNIIIDLMVFIYSAYSNIFLHLPTLKLYS